MIRITDLHRKLGGVPVLAGIDLEVEAGEVLALIGPSGTGKSVLLKHIIGLLEPDRGDVLVGGRSVVKATYRQLAVIRRGMGYVFQDAALLDSLTLEENLRLALDDAACRRSPGYAAARIAASMAAVNLPTDALRKRPGELSGGMRKRGGVARAILNEPSVLLYDEPTTGLDPRNAAGIHRLIRSIRNRLGATSLVVTHDITALPGLADRVALLEGGRVRFLGTPAELLASDDAGVVEFLGRGAADPFEPQEESWLDTPVVATSR
jgi:phospholipid/cholesterol/gamma-HCH transport system ATP-binding protein